jgi:RimJ/RimL family protein N-acetyltransferase
LAEIRPKRMLMKSGRMVTIRSAIPLDAASLIDFIKDVLIGADWSATQSHEVDTSIEKEVGWIEDHGDSPGKLILVAQSDREIVGMLHFANGVRERNHHAGTLGMSVRNDWRRQGLGQALIQNLLEWARADPLIEKVSLVVFSTNEPAIRLYHRMGFIEEGRQKREYRLSNEMYVDGILMYQVTGA